MENAVLKVKRINAHAALPNRATEGASGFDVYACLRQPVWLQIGTMVRIPTGIIMEVPEGWHCLVHGRSGLASKGVMTFVGVIDSDFRGELCVMMYRLHGSESLYVMNGDRIAQLVFIPHLQGIEVSEVQELSETERGGQGYGSTGR